MNITWQWVAPAWSTSTVSAGVPSRKITPDTSATSCRTTSMSCILPVKDYFGQMNGKANGQRRIGQEIHCKSHSGLSNKGLVENSEQKGEMHSLNWDPHKNWSPSTNITTHGVHL